MTTNELLQLLAADAAPVPRHTAEKRLASAALAGTALALVWVLYGLGVHAGVAMQWADAAFWAKLAMPLAVVALDLPLLWRLAHPGMATRGWSRWTLWPVLCLWGWAAWVWFGSPATARPGLVLGPTWTVCSFNIVVMALPVGVGLFWALRGLAPTRPVLAGTVAGWCAGALGATAYALHCPETAAPFVAVWYVLGMAICALLGALRGWRGLRW